MTLAGAALLFSAREGKRAREAEQAGHGRLPQADDGSRGLYEAQRRAAADARVHVVRTSCTSIERALQRGPRLAGAREGSEAMKGVLRGAAVEKGKAALSREGQEGEKRRFDAALRPGYR